MDASPRRADVATLFTSILADAEASVDIARAEGAAEELDARAAEPGESGALSKTLAIRATAALRRLTRQSRLAWVELVARAACTLISNSCAFLEQAKEAGFFRAAAQVRLLVSRHFVGATHIARNDPCECSCSKPQVAELVCREAPPSLECAGVLARLSALVREWVEEGVEGCLRNDSATERAYASAQLDDGVAPPKDRPVFGRRGDDIISATRVDFARGALWERG